MPVFFYLGYAESTGLIPANKRLIEIDGGKRKMQETNENDINDSALSEQDRAGTDVQTDSMQDQATHDTAANQQHTEQDNMPTVLETQREKDYNDRLAALEQREAAFARKELEAQTKELLLKNNLPQRFYKYVIGCDLGETQNNIEEFNQEYCLAVQAAVEARFRGRTPRVSSGGSNEDYTNLLDEVRGSLE